MTSRLALLVVDDSEADREIIALTLGAAFPRALVRRAADPLAAKEMCSEQAFDCVLTDYNMPDMDGVTLGGELRAAHPYLAVILMTNFGDEMLAAEALRGGISDYIPKSRITAESVQRTVERSIHTCVQARLIDEQRTEIENFAYALAHDFKQPIRQIITFSRLIAEEAEVDHASSIGQHLGFLGDAAGRLGKLVDVMLQYTLLNQPPALEDVDLNRVLANVRTSLAPYLAERGAELVPPSGAARVRGNETLLTQVLQNLVMNGLQYNRSPVPRVEITARARPDHWLIEIKDNGLGIEAEYLGEIFKPLVRLHTAAEYAGSGLGLTLARKAVVAQKGVIWCESTPGRGSVFSLQLPVAQADPKRSSKAEPAASAVRRRPAEAT